MQDLLQATVVVLYINPIKTTFDFNINLLTCKQKKLSIKKAITCKLVIGNKRFNYQNFLKSRLHCIDIIADHCVKKREL